MESIKTTEELLEILKAEFKACMNGQRTFPLPANAEEKVVELTGFMGAFLGAERMLHVANYHEFREQVQAYQVANQVSGLTVKTIEINGKTYRFPEISDQLVLLDSDVQILKAAKDRIAEVFLDYCRNNFVYCCFDYCSPKQGQWEIQTTCEYIAHIAANCEWAEIGKIGKYSGAGLWLALGWGNPVDARCRDGKDSDFLGFEAQLSCAWNGPPGSCNISD